jgi:hypothetical protein
MKLRIFFLLITAIVLTLLSCQPSGTPSMISELNACDSAVIMYYKTPGNPRFFQMVKVYDVSLLKTFAGNANANALPSQDDCTTQGKIYYYGDRGEVFVLYFANSDTCKRLSFIKTGEKYGLELSPRSRQILDSLKAFSYEPKAAY